MAKTRLKEAIASAQRQKSDDDLKPLVDSIVAGVAQIIMSRLQQNPDRTDEILEALVARESSIVKAVGELIPDAPPPPDPPPPVDLGPLNERIQKLENLVKQAVDNINLSSDTAWDFEHKRDGRGRMSHTIARPMNGNTSN